MSIYADASIIVNFGSFHTTFRIVRILLPVRQNPIEYVLLSHLLICSTMRITMLFIALKLEIHRYGMPNRSVYICELCVRIDIRSICEIGAHVTKSPRDCQKKKNYQFNLT